ncbi:MAG: hypothetical protein ACJ79R_05410 [Anaeromyxobacteraceae bacterium]
MAATLRYFMLPDDERAFFRTLDRHEITIYPETVPADWKAPRASDEVVASLDQDAYYLAVERLAPVIVHTVKRGRDKGLLKIEETPSPVFHYERSRRNEENELVGGRLWAELDVTELPAASDARYKPSGLRSIFRDIEDSLRKSFRRSDPKGYWVGPAAARAWKSEGLVLREPGHKGDTFGVWR